jgi:monothiol glutaredoxin
MTMNPAIAERIRHEIEVNKVVLFMKGTPVFPQCSGSAQATQILGLLGVAYKSIDVLADPSVRDGIKDYSNWPMLPQLYVNGVFIGGNDIMRQMLETGDLAQLFIEKTA